MSKSKFYEVTDIDALTAFNPKAVKMVPQFDNALILRLLRDFDVVPGVKRTAVIAEVEQQNKEAATATLAA